MSLDVLVERVLFGGFLLGVICELEDGGDWFFLNVTTQHYRLEDHTLHSHRCENLRSTSKIWNRCFK
jgi:hypothetical protein